MDEKMELIERLRLIAAWHTPGGKTPDRRCPSKHKACTEAATLIEQQAAELERLREALRPFVEGYAHTSVFLRSREKMHPTGQDLYREDVERARTALGEKP